MEWRLDYWKYNRDQLLPSQNNRDMGQEVSLLVLYEPTDYLLMGATGGYWMPGKYMKEDLGIGENVAGVLGGYFFFSTSFDFKISFKGGEK